MSATQQQRLAAGKCPQCGKDAAPYRLCHRCRSTAQIRRFARRGAECGALRYETDPADRRKKLVSLKDKAKADDFDFASPGLVGAIDPEQDRRYRPRLRGVPVDVLKQTIAILEARGMPMHEDEIMAAWGRLRVNPDRKSAANDLVQIIAAETKRRRKAKRRVTK